MLLLQLARELEHGQRPELLVEHQHLDLGLGQQRHDLVAGLRRGEHRDVARLLGQRDDRGGALGIGEPEGDARVHQFPGGSLAIVGGSVYSRLSLASGRFSSPRRISAMRISLANVSA